MKVRTISSKCLKNHSHLIWKFQRKRELKLYIETKMELSDRPHKKNRNKLGKEK